MSRFDFDLFTIGGGSGGVRASRLSGSYGAKVAVAEERYLGGTCVNVGCVPKKLLFYASHFKEDFENARGFGWQSEIPEFNWKKLIENKDKEIQRLNDIYRKLLTNSNVEIYEGKASLEDKHTIRVGDKKYTAKNILIATGGWPMIPNIPGKEFIASSNEMFYLDELPEKIVVVGGGYIAVEFAGIFNGLGSEMTLIYRGPLFLRGFDEDIRNFLLEEMKKKGINIIFETDVEEIQKLNTGKEEYKCKLKNKAGETQELTCNKVLYATGRVPKVDGLNLSQVGVQQAPNNSIKVDDYFKTSVDNIYAIGDVIDRVKLTPVALAEGNAIAKNLFQGQNLKTDYSDIPTAVFSQPNIGTVGLTEEQAKEKYGDIAVYINNTKPMKHTLSGSDERALLKLIVDKKSNRVVGFHMVGAEAGEITQGIGIAMKCNATKAHFDSTIGIHPTLAEEIVTMREPAR